MNQPLSLPQHIESGWWLTIPISRNNRGFLLYNFTRHRFSQHAHQVEISCSLTEAIVSEFAFLIPSKCTPSPTILLAPLVDFISNTAAIQGGTQIWEVLQDRLIDKW